MPCHRAVLASLAPLLRRAVPALLALFTLVLAGPAHAVYIQRFSSNANGAITFTGNTLGLDSSAAFATPGTRGSQGAFINSNNPAAWGTYPANTVGASAASSTLWSQNASQANLVVAPGSTVLYAELIWGGVWSAGGATLTPAQLDSAVTFTTPGGSYSIAPAAASAQTTGTGSGGTCSVGPCRYARSQNVTGQVQLAGAGSYTVGGVPAAYGNDANAHASGWTLAVVYGNPGMPARNLTVFTGLEAGGNAPAAVSGFCTPTTGTPQGRLLVTAMEGDSAITGDQMLFGPSTTSLTALSGANNLVGNFFASQINRDTGALDTSGTHGTRNHPPGSSNAGARQGWDITNVDASPGLAVNQSSAFAQGTTSGDQYQISALALQIDLGAPRFPVTTKTVDKSTTFVGDVLTYSVVLNNQGSGNAHATNVVFTDTPPAGTAFRSGTVTVNGVSQPGFNPASGFNLGTINAGSAVTVTFQADVLSLPAAPAPARFENSARWTYDYVPCAGQPSQSTQLVTNPVVTTAARLAPAKAVSPGGAVSVGQTLTYTISVPNNGLANTTGTRLTDPIPTGTSYLPGTTFLNGVAVADAPGPAMPFAAGATINSAGSPAGQINAGSAATIQFQVSVNPAAPTTLTNTASVDPDGAGAAAPINVRAVNSGLAAPAASKVFAPALIPAGTVSTLTVTLSNANASVLAGAGFTDTLPAGVLIANPANLANTCGGCAAAAPGGTTLSLTGGSIPASGSCSVSASVAAAAAGSYANVIPAGAVSATDAGSNGAAASATLTVTAAPTVNKAFSPATVLPNQDSTLTINLVNPSATPMSAAALTDSLPSGVVVAAVPAVVNGCGGSVSAVAGAASVALSGGTIPPQGVCAFSVNVRAASAGTYLNNIPAGALSTSGGASTAAASATLNAVAPQVTKSFSPNPVGVNVNSSLTIALINASPAAITGAAFTDTYPSGVVNAPTPGAATTCGGTVTAVAGGTSIALTGGTIPALGSCTVTVSVRTAAGGLYTNTIAAGGLTSSNAGANTVAASADLVVGRPSVAKAFGATAIAAGSQTALTITLTNPSAAAITIANSPSLDVLPAGITIANPPAPATTCGTTISAPNGANTIGINGGTIAANASCTVTVTVSAATPADYTNTIAAGAFNTSIGSNPLPASDALLVLARPTLAKSFAPTPVAPSGSSTLTIVLTNTNGVDLTGVGFTDTFPTTPGAMTVASPLATSNSCGGTLLDNLGGALTAADAGVRLSGGAIPAGGSCTITVAITTPTAGTYTNSIAAGGLTGTAQGVALSNAAAANATLSVVVQPPSIAKAFAPNPVSPNVPTTLTFTVSNPNPASALTGVAFSDTFPTLPGAMVVAPVPAASTSGCGAPTFAPVAGAASVSFSSGSIAAGATCTVSVNVVAPALGSYNNVSSAVSSTNGGSGNSASATLVVPRTPEAAKSFAPTSVAAGTASVLTLVVSNPNSTAAILGATLSDTYPLGLFNTSTPNAAVNCSFGSMATLIGGVAGGNSIGLSGGTLGPSGSCTITVNVSAGTAGAYVNTTGNVVSMNAGTGNAASATLTVAVGGFPVSGFVYNDANANQTMDGFEAGAGGSLFVKLVPRSGASCVGPATASAAVNPGSGSYAFAAVAAGDHCLISDDNATLADISPTAPTGWIGTEAGTGRRDISLSAPGASLQNFGLFNGSVLTGRVFRDTGAGGGTANDALQNGSEPGIASASVRATDNAGTLTLAAATTDSAGDYTLWIPASAGPNPIRIVEANLGGFVSTGGAAGSTGGAYLRSTDTTSFANVVGARHSGVNFADVPDNAFTTDGVQSALPGATLWYPHGFTAGSGGSVAFASAATASPALAGWSEVLYRDSNCNGVLDGSEGAGAIGAAIAVNAGETVCVLLKEFVPAGAPGGAQNLVTVTANFTYSNASPALASNQAHTDTTTVGAAGSAGLSLQKSVDKATALPGEVLTYTVVYTNTSNAPLSSIVINDSTPAFTNFLSAACGPNPPNVGACSVSSQPAPNATGAIAWTLTGTLAPGASSSVTFSVRVAL